MSRIDDYIASFTEEERAKLKDLIDECRDRAKLLEKLDLYQKTEKLSNTLSKMNDLLGNVRETSSELLEDMQSLELDTTIARFNVHKEIG